MSEMIFLPLLRLDTYCYRDLRQSQHAAELTDRVARRRTAGGRDRSSPCPRRTSRPTSSCGGTSSSHCSGSCAMICPSRLSLDAAQRSTGSGSAMCSTTSAKTITSYRRRRPRRPRLARRDRSRHAAGECWRPLPARGWPRRRRRRPGGRRCSWPLAAAAADVQHPGARRYQGCDLMPGMVVLEVDQILAVAGALGRRLSHLGSPAAGTGFAAASTRRSHASRQYG